MTAEGGPAVGQDYGRVPPVLEVLAQLHLALGVHEDSNALVVHQQGASVRPGAHVAEVVRRAVHILLALELLRHGLRGGGEVYDALLSAGGVQEAQVVRAHVVGVLVFFFLSAGEALGQLEHGHAHRLGDEQVAVFSGGNAVYVGVAVLALLRRGGGSVARQLAHRAGGGVHAPELLNRALCLLVVIRGVKIELAPGEADAGDITRRAAEVRELRGPDQARGLLAWRVRSLLALGAAAAGEQPGHQSSHEQERGKAFAILHFSVLQ